MSPAKKPLEQQIKDYFDQYGAILVGMHEDIQGQQKMIDLKVKAMQAQTKEITVEFEKEIGRRAKELHKAAEDLAEAVKGEDERHQRRVQEFQEKIYEAEQFLANLNNIQRKHHQDLLASLEMNARKAIDMASGEAKAITCRVSKRQDELESTIERQKKVFSNYVERFRVAHEEIALQSIKLADTTEAHQKREAEFNQRVRIAWTAAITIAIILVLSGALYAIVR